jgi:hypothetical protein
MRAATWRWNDPTTAAMTVNLVRRPVLLACEVAVEFNRSATDRRRVVVRREEHRLELVPFAQYRVSDREELGGLVGARERAVARELGQPRGERRRFDPDLVRALPLLDARDALERLDQVVDVGVIDHRGPDPDELRDLDPVLLEEVPDLDRADDVRVHGHPSSPSENGFSGASGSVV